LFLHHLFFGGWLCEKAKVKIENETKQRKREERKRGGQRVSRRPLKEDEKKKQEKEVSFIITNSIAK
jgi:hypothetical protein